MLLHLDAATADSAIQACAAKGAHLATMTCKAEQEFVTARRREDAWIGLRATPPSNDKSDFNWTTGEPVSFTAWDTDDPNESSGCVIIKFDYDAGRNWSDRPCSDLYVPLCETTE